MDEDELLIEEAESKLEFVKEGVIEEYYLKAISTAREIGEKADYGIGYEFTEEEAESVIDENINKSRHLL